MLSASGAGSAPVDGFHRAAHPLLTDPICTREITTAASATTLMAPPGRSDNPSSPPNGPIRSSSLIPYIARWGCSLHETRTQCSEQNQVPPPRAGCLHDTPPGRRRRLAGLTGLSLALIATGSPALAVTGLGPLAATARAAAPSDGTLTVRVVTEVDADGAYDSVLEPGLAGCQGHPDGRRLPGPERDDRGQRHRHLRGHDRAHGRQVPRPGRQPGPRQPLPRRRGPGRGRRRHPQQRRLRRRLRWYGRHVHHGFLGSQPVLPGEPDPGHLQPRQGGCPRHVQGPGVLRRGLHR